jgi:hypothetical protein
MKLLLDMGVAPRTADFLKALGPNSWEYGLDFRLGQLYQLVSTIVHGPGVVRFADFRCSGRLRHARLRIFSA